MPRNGFLSTLSCVLWTSIAVAAPTHQYTFTLDDASGFADAQGMDIFISSLIDRRASCYLSFTSLGEDRGVLELDGDVGTPASLAPTSLAIPGTGSAGNGRCFIDAAESSVSSAGQTVTLKLALAFAPDFAGAPEFHIAARGACQGRHPTWMHCASGSGMSRYDQAILADHPVAFWDVSGRGTTESDLTGNGNTGTYQGGTPGLEMLPNGDNAAVFNGSSEYLTVPSRSSLSIATTGSLTWEMWISPTVLQYPESSSGGFVEVMGKCAHYSPTCEWESRMYSTTNPQNRCNRMSAYAYNATAGLGSGADWQPVCGLLHTGEWLHIVGEYTTKSQPSDCPNSPSFPGSIDIWVNGVKWDQAVHNPTGCMSQYSVVPQANNSPLNIGSMSLETWFAGAIGKVAIYNYELTQAQITNHYQTMTGKAPTGSCGATCSF